jgi:hypothetical protein
MEGDGPYGVAGGQPFWRRTGLRRDRWREINPFHLGSRAACDPPKQRRLKVWKLRSRRGLGVGDLLRGLSGGGKGGGLYGTNGVVGVCGLARGRDGEQRAIFDQLFSPEPALAQRVGEDRDFSMFRFEPGEE